MSSSSEDHIGTNSEDEHYEEEADQISPQEWERRDEEFEVSLLEKGLEVKRVGEDGACLFRSVSLLLFGSEELHFIVRQKTMDYMAENRDNFSPFVTEDFDSYIKRKRGQYIHGNSLEITAISQLYERPVHVYIYQATPNIQISGSQGSQSPLRLAYQRNNHYNAIVDLCNASQDDELIEQMCENLLITANQEVTSNIPGLLLDSQPPSEASSISPTLTSDEPLTDTVDNELGKKRCYEVLEEQDTDAPEAKLQKMQRCTDDIDAHRPESGLQPTLLLSQRQQTGEKEGEFMPEISKCDAREDHPQLSTSEQSDSPCESCSTICQGSQTETDCPPDCPPTHL